MVAQRIRANSKVSARGVKEQRGWWRVINNLSPPHHSWSLRYRDGEPSPALPSRQLHPHTFDGWVQAVQQLAHLRQPQPSVRENPLQRSLSSDLLRQLDLALSHIWRKTTNQSKEQWAIRWNGMTEWGQAGGWVEELLSRNAFNSHEKWNKTCRKWACKKWVSLK